jgi:hypothetical protein
MKTKREMPLSEALEEISSTVERLKEEGAARVNRSEVKLDDPVMLEIEMEAEKGQAEIEFEIKWPPAKSKPGSKERGKGGGRRRLFFGAVTGIALGAAALTMMRRRRRSEEEDDI